MNHTGRFIAIFGGSGSEIDWYSVGTENRTKIAQRTGRYPLRTGLAEETELTPIVRIASHVVIKSIYIYTIKLN